MNLDDRQNDQPEQPVKRYYPPPNEVFIVLVITLTVSMLAGSFLVDFGKIGAILLELLFIVPPVVYLRRKGYSISRCLRWNRVPKREFLSALLIGIGLIVLLDEADRLLSLLYPMPAEAYEALNDFLSSESWTDHLLLWTGTVFAAAICEESLFRGFIQLSLEAFGNVTRAVVFGALLFALAHFNPWWLIQILILGVFLGYISWRANSVLPAIFIHGLHNALALISTRAFEQGDWQWYTMGDHVAPSVLIAAGAMLFLGLKFFSRQTEYTFPAKPAIHDQTQS